MQLWALRDSVEQTGRYASIYTFDVSLRVSHMEAYLADVNARLEARYEDVNNFTFGHMGDGNLHLVISVGQGGPETRRAVEACVYEPLATIQGSVSAEHGVGLFFAGLEERWKSLGLCSHLTISRWLVGTLPPIFLIYASRIIA